MPRARSSPELGRSSRRREGSSLRRERALVRRRLATPPPDYPSATFQDPDDDGPFGAGDTDALVGAEAERGRTRRTRLRLALAALPLAVAVTLFAVSGLDGGPAPAPDLGTAGAEGSGMDGAPLAPALVPGAVDATVPSDMAETADVSALPRTLPAQGPEQDPAGTFPDRGVESGTDRRGADGDSVDGNAADARTVPTAPSGHRPVAIRIADPAALSLVAVGDHVDVVGMDGSVLAERLEVLQDRSSGTGSVLVLAAPDRAGPALAAAALSREVTVILSGEP